MAASESGYTEYKRSGGRYSEIPTCNKRRASPESTPFSPTSWMKRVKATVNVSEKHGIFCSQFKCQGDNNS